MNLSPEEFNFLKSLYNNEPSASYLLSINPQNISLTTKGFIHFDSLSDRFLLTREGSNAFLVKEGQLKSFQSSKSDKPNNKDTAIAQIMIGITPLKNGWSPEQIEEYAKIIVRYQGVKDE